MVRGTQLGSNLPPPLPSPLPRYALGKVIGSGAYGIVRVGKLVNTTSASTASLSAWLWEITGSQLQSAFKL